jgi:hypothetical protein
MPLLLFTGVNGVGRTFVIAFALLSGESAESFTWAIDRFIHCLGGTIFMTVISDNDGAFTKAMDDRLPAVDHQLCTWHLMKRVVENLKGKLSTSERMDAALQKVHGLIYAALVFSVVDVIVSTKISIMCAVMKRSIRPFGLNSSPNFRKLFHI